MNDSKIMTCETEKAALTQAQPSKLFVEVTTRCNLGCGMCVKQNGNGGIREGDMTDDIFDALIPAFPRLDALILNGVGESLLHPGLEVFIEKARGLMPEGAWVGFQSNGMLLKGPRALSLVDAGLDRICISVDSASEDGFCSIRQGGDLGGVKAAFFALGRAGAKKTGFKMGAEFVLRKDNVRELPKVLRFAGRSGASFVIVSQLMPYHESLAGQAAYDTNTKEAVAIYRKWKKEALDKGVELGRYFEVFMKSSKNPSEKDIVGYIERMKKEAGDRNVTLHLERLLKRDEKWYADMEAVFEEARSIAREYDIELALPEIAPRNYRECEFVESGGSFVSWDGDVHPCYFLWHGYPCYVGGFEKHVRPWAFGNLRDRDIISIWNDRKYSDFRQAVLRYQFPFCFDCSFALCDYVREEDFEQDCYIQSIPCGSCLWCTGLFRCMQ